MNATVVSSQIALETPVIREERIHVRTGGQPTYFPDGSSLQGRTRIYESNCADQVSRLGIARRRGLQASTKIRSLPMLLMAGSSVVFACDQATEPTNSRPLIVGFESLNRPRRAEWQRHLFPSRQTYTFSALFDRVTQVTWMQDNGFPRPSQQFDNIVLIPKA